MFYFIYLQEAKQGLESAQNEAATSTSEEGKAEAMIAVECYEAIIKALETHWGHFWNVRYGLDNRAEV